MTKDLAVFNPSNEVLDIIAGIEDQVELANSHVVTDMATYDWADKDAKSVHEMIKTLESAKEIAIRPLKNLLDERTNYFNPAIKRLGDVKEALRRKLKKYKQRQDAVAAAARREAEQAAEAAGVDAPIIESAVPKGNTKYRDNWTYKITDWIALLEWVGKNARTNAEAASILAPNDKLLKAMAKDIKKEGPSTVVPGLEIINDQITF